MPRMASRPAVDSLIRHACAKQSAVSCNLPGCQEHMCAALLSRQYSA
jgi:hypothetical protein